MTTHETSTIELSLVLLTFMVVAALWSFHTSSVLLLLLLVRLTWLILAFRVVVTTVIAGTRSLTRRGVVGLDWFLFVAKSCHNSI